MKKFILYGFVVTVILTTTNQLISSATSNNFIQNEVTFDGTKNDNEITKLDEEYISRTEELNQDIKNNLVDSITLINNQITINYQNLKPELYSEDIYQIILSPEYLNSLETQYQLKVIKFDANNHINFTNSNRNKRFISNSNVGGEGHGYGFAYGKLHLSNNAINTILNYASKLGGLSAATQEKITKFISKFITSATSAIVAAIIAAFIITNFIILLGYSNHLPGCGLGVLGIVPGVGGGSN